MKTVNMDLHMHSIKSCDGEYTPSELMKMCKEAGMQVVAIADHNTVEAMQEARTQAETLGMEYIPAVELDCHIDGVDLHVLGYGIDETNEALLRLAEDVRKMEQGASQRRIDLVKAQGIYVDEKAAYAIAPHGNVTGEIIAEIALQDERNYDALKAYLPGGTRADNPLVNFYWDVCSQGKPAYVPINYITLKEAVELITQAGGIAILAHPGNNTKENEELLETIFAYDVKGLEAYSSYHTQEQVAFYVDWAKKRNLLITAGSDFHGKTKPAISIGDTKCTDTTDLYYALSKALPK